MSKARQKALRSSGKCDLSVICSYYRKTGFTTIAIATLCFCSQLIPSSLKSFRRAIPQDNLPKKKRRSLVESLLQGDTSVPLGTYRAFNSIARYNRTLQPSNAIPRYNPRYTIRTIQCPRYDAHDTMPTIQCPRYNAHVTMPTIQPVRNSPHNTIHNRTYSQRIMATSTLVSPHTAGLCAATYDPFSSPPPWTCESS